MFTNICTFNHTWKKYFLELFFGGLTGEFYCPITMGKIFYGDFFTAGYNFMTVNCYFYFLRFYNPTWAKNGLRCTKGFFIALQKCSTLQLFAEIDKKQSKASLCGVWTCFSLLNVSQFAYLVSIMVSVCKCY